MVGSSKESDISVCGTKTLGLIDSGSMITSISESFYDSLKAKPPLRDITEFGLSVLGASGSQMPYKGYIEADISVPFLGKTTYILYPYLLSWIPNTIIRFQL